MEKLEQKSYMIHYRTQGWSAYFTVNLSRRPTRKRLYDLCTKEMYKCPMYEEEKEETVIWASIFVGIEAVEFERNDDEYTMGNEYIMGFGDES